MRVVIKDLDKTQENCISLEVRFCISLKKFEVDVNPQHMEIPEDTFVYCMQHAIEMRNNRYTYLHEADLNEGYLRKIYKELVEEL